MAASPKQQRINPDDVEKGVNARTSGSKQDGSNQGGAKQPGPKQTPKKGRPTPKRPAVGPRDAEAREKSAKKAARTPQKNVIEKPKPATARDWIAGARPQTLALAIAPVLLGTAVATLFMTAPWEHWARAVLCLVVAFALQIGVNFANDYSDGIRGTDGAERQGPRRLVGSGAAKASTVRTVAFVFFGIAAVAGIILTVVSAQWWLLAVGALAIVAAWFYTGGKRPYGYAGLGEVVVFIFFGLVATLGTMFVQAGSINLEGWLVAVAAGMFACAVLMSNNLRDLEKDALVGKRTLAVIAGPVVARILYVVFMLVPYAILVFFVLFYFNAGYVYFTLLAALPAILISLFGRSAREYLVVLRLTVVTTLLYALGLSAAIAF
ncbi:MAG: 1,4-dihydroxy-2-naphthoate polyprenyltransferase [Microbacteriaceae bacterium]